MTSLAAHLRGTVSTIREEAVAFVVALVMGLYFFRTSVFHAFFYDYYRNPGLTAAVSIPWLLAALAASALVGTISFTRHVEINKVLGVIVGYSVLTLPIIVQQSLHTSGAFGLTPPPVLDIWPLLLYGYVFVIPLLLITTTVTRSLFWSLSAAIFGFYMFNGIGISAAKDSTPVAHLQFTGYLDVWLTLLIFAAVNIVGLYQYRQRMQEKTRQAEKSR